MLEYNDIIKKYGNDWTDLDMSERLSLDNADLTNIVLPKNIDFFRNFYGRDLRCVRLPKGDYSGYNFKNVFMRCKFT